MNGLSLKKLNPDFDLRKITNYSIKLNGYRCGDDVQIYHKFFNIYQNPLRRPQIWRVCFLTRDGGIIVTRKNKYRELLGTNNEAS